MLEEFQYNSINIRSVHFLFQVIKSLTKIIEVGEVTWWNLSMAISHFCDLESSTTTIGGFGFDKPFGASSFFSLGLAVILRRNTFHLVQ